MAIRFTQKGSGVVFALKVVPGASRQRVAGPLGEALKVTVCQPAESGAANRAVVQLLAETLGVPSSAVRIITGHGSPRKQVMVDGVTVEALRKKWM